MATRLSFRPRPLDINKQLAIVRDLTQLDSTDGLVSRDITHNHEALDKENEEAKMVQSDKAKGGKEIPVPEVRIVEQYRVEYLPTFKPPNTYIHGKGGYGYQDESFIEYDLDKEDDAWLLEYNRGQPRLTDTKLEAMLWRLETRNAAATDAALAAAGASLAERTSPSAVAATDYMTAEQALEALAQAANTRDVTRLAVFEYWKEKRKRHGRPLLRRLQAPTSVTDTDPFHVFRPRERIHRPQTRRRRENNQESFEKMLAIRANLHRAKEILEAIIRRERKKRDLAYLEVDSAQLQLKLRHDPLPVHEAVEAEYQGHLKFKGRRPIGFEGGETPAEMKERRVKKRKREQRRYQPDAVSKLPPPPEQHIPPPMVWLHLPSSLDELLAQLPGVADPLRVAAEYAACASGGGGPDRRRCRPRIGRCARLLLDRCNALTLSTADLDPETPVPAMHELPNPYQGAAAAVARRETALSPAGRGLPPPVPQAATPGTRRAAAAAAAAAATPQQSTPRAAAVAAAANARAATPQQQQQQQQGPPQPPVPLKRGPGRPPKVPKTPTAAFPGQPTPMDTS